MGNVIVRGLDWSAREEIKSRGFSIAGYTRHYFAADKWGGDQCGCTDDRCIGHHHDANEACGCLPVLLDQYDGAP